jgi:hypothetical protein
MDTENFTDWTLRVNLELLLTYSNLASTIAKALERITETHDDHTVVHVHVDDGCMPEAFAKSHREELIYLPSTVGLHKTTSPTCTTIVSIALAVRFIDSDSHRQLRRVDIFLTPVKRT